MNRPRHFHVPALVSLLLVSVLILTSVADAAPPAVGGNSAESASGPTVGETLDRQGPPVLHRAYPGGARASIPARRSPGELAAARISTFSVNYLAAGTVWRDYVCQAWPPEAKAAFGYATSVWGSLLKSSVPVTIDACWTLLEQDVFGGAFPTGYARNFAEAPLRDTWYPYALANALHGSDINTTLVDITAVFSSGFPWYFGTSGSPGTGQFDFATAVLRELGYGLGYESSMWVEGDTGNWGISRVDDQVISPDVYDRLVVNGSGQSLIGGFPNASSALAAQLQSNDVFFDGAQAKAANGGNRPKLFAPSPWKEGWSISYLDPIHDGSPNALMTYTLTPGEVVHDPGPMGLAILNDLGWSGVPTVTALRPASGSVGASVSIGGTNLSHATALSFNGVGASFTSFSGAEIVATVPAGATSGPVRVTTPNGTASSTNSFTVTDVEQPQVAFLGTPARLVDTRPMSGFHYAGQALQGYSAAPRRFKIAGEGGVPCERDGGPRQPHRGRLQG